MRHTDGGEEDFSAVLATAKRAGEEAHIMRDPKTGRFHRIRPHGYQHWLQHYEAVSHITFLPHVTGRQA